MIEFKCARLDFYHVLLVDFFLKEFYYKCDFKAEINQAWHLNIPRLYSCCYKFAASLQVGRMILKPFKLGRLVLSPGA